MKMKEIEFEGIPESRKMLGMTLLKRIDDFVLYVTNCYSFEVHRIRLRTNYHDSYRDIIVKNKEILASSGEFGTYAWCFTRLSTTIRYFGMFGEHIDEIMQKLENLGFKDLPSPKRNVMGYVF